ncbi:hypothetical protein SESBI_49562 [Sesbania bispinosa]|nr:hypothetical protein SESBI_49562 [Sesbania bispinosa]
MRRSSALHCLLHLQLPFTLPLLRSAAVLSSSTSTCASCPAPSAAVLSCLAAPAVVLLLWIYFKT